MTPTQRAESMCELLLSMQREIREHKNLERDCEVMIEENRALSTKIENHETFIGVLQKRIAESKVAFENLGQKEKSDAMTSVLYLIEELRGKIL